MASKLVARNKKRCTRVNDFPYVRPALGNKISATRCIPEGIPFMFEMYFSE
jgi:hypothetical protein